MYIYIEIKISVHDIAMFRPIRTRQVDFEYTIVPTPWCTGRDSNPQTIGSAIQISSHCATGPVSQRANAPK